MIPLSVVTQGRYDPYTTVFIDESRTTPLSLYDHFVSVVKRNPKPNESIKFVVTNDTTLIGTLHETQQSGDRSALYIRKTDFLSTNTLVLENRGAVLGRGGDGRTNGTVHINILSPESRPYLSPRPDRSEGGSAIANESDTLLTVINKGLLAGGGSGGGALGDGAYATTKNAMVTVPAPGDWRVDIMGGPGGGGVPNGLGGKDDHRAEDLISGNYDEPLMQDQAKIVAVQKAVRPEPATLQSNLGDPKIFLTGIWDTASTAYTIPLVKEYASNWLPPGLVLKFAVKSPLGSAHYNMYKSDIEGPDKDRIVFYKTFKSMLAQGPAYKPTDSLSVLTGPYYLGENASMLKPGKGGHHLTDHIGDKYWYAKGYVAARGGDGGELGRRGKFATPHDEYILYKPQGTSSYITKSIKDIKRDHGLEVESARIYGSPSTLPGNPGYLARGNVQVINDSVGETIGRIDVYNLKKNLSQFGNIIAMKYFEIIPDASASLAIRVDSVVMTDAISNHPPVTISTFKVSEYSIISDSLDSITLSRTSQLPVGNYSFIAINEYGIHPVLNVTSSTVTIGDIYYNMGYHRNPEISNKVELTLVCADAATIEKIRSNISAMKLHSIDWYGRT